MMLVSILPVVGLVGASNLSTAIIILGIAVVLIFVASPKYGQFMDDISGLCIYGNFSCLGKLSAGTSCNLAAIRKSMKRVIRHCKDCMQLDVEDCLAEGLEQLYSKTGICAGSTE